MKIGDDAALLDQLRTAWQWNELNRTALPVLEHHLDEDQAGGRLTLETIASNLEDTPLVLSALVPLFVDNLSAQDHELRKQAAAGLGMVAKMMGDASAGLEHLGALLSDTEVADTAASSLWWMARRGYDLAPVDDELQEALRSEDHRVRGYASRAISLQKVETGQEEVLDLHPHVYMEQWWKGTVSHRRTYASSGEVLGEEIVGPGRCGTCGDFDVAMIFHRDESTEVWRDEVLEYICQACSKFTVYETFS